MHEDKDDYDWQKIACENIDAMTNLLSDGREHIVKIGAEASSVADIMMTYRPDSSSGRHERRMTHSKKTKKARKKNKAARKARRKSRR